MKDAVPKYLRRRRPFRKGRKSKWTGHIELQIPTIGKPSTAGVCYAALAEDLIGRTLPLAK